MGAMEEFKLARVVDACGGIDGRVKMQKIVYLLKQMGYALPFDDFIIRQHGPFSRSLANTADMLSEGGFLREREEAIACYLDREPVFQYSYSVEDAVRDLVRQHFDVQAPEGKPTVEEVATDLRQKDRPVLEVAATELYLERECGLPPDEVSQQLVYLKGHLQAHFERAKTLLSDLRARELL